MKKSPCFSAADILLPDFRKVSAERWAVVACDQFTSEPEYWERAEAIVGDAPSTLRLILPEVRLDRAEESVPEIHADMEKYVREVLVSHPDSMIYVRRTQLDGTIRRGLLLAVDLECYDYRKGAGSLIRATEATVVERNPPRMAVRRGAELELPHVMLLIDDPEDGVIAPLFYMMLGGAPLALTYKAINTMDSMLGYKNEKYLYFGRAAAKLDDVANYIPSRLAALLWIMAAAFTRNDAKGAWRIWRRDRRNHASPNSAQTESACAGALNVQLAGPAYYFGQYYPKPTIGDAVRPIEPEDIRRADRMMYAESLLALALGLVIRGIL